MRLPFPLLCICICLLQSAFSQQPAKILFKEKKDKPQLFSQLPQRFQANRTALQDILSRQPGDSFTATLGDGFVIKGTVLEKVQQPRGIISINVRLENYHNALMNIVVRLLADHSLAMSGRIHHFKYGDVLMLEREKSAYVFTKTSQRLFLPD